MPSLPPLLVRVLGLFLSCGVLLAATTAGAAAQTPSPTPTPAKTAPKPVKASEILRDAAKYVGVPYVYGGFSPKGFDCSGYVSWVWQIPRRTTDTIDDMVRPIGKDELLPGDLLNMPSGRDPSRFGHMRIFDKWATADRALVWVYEETEPQVMHRVVPYDPRYAPLRRLNVVSDVPMPPPPPLPKDWSRPPKPPAPQPAPKPPATIVGRVVDERSGAPVTSARLFYWSAEERYSVRSVVTDDQGRYRVERVDAGTYEIAAYAAGYDVEFRGGLDLRTGGTATFDLRLAPALGALAGSRLGPAQGPALPQPADRPARDVAPPADEPPASLPLDHAVPNGWFYSQTAGRDGIGGFAVTDEGGVRFWSEFKRLGGVQAVGYPVSRRFKQKGFTVQAFQKGILQWRPEVGQAWFTNVFDELSEAGKDDWLLQHRSTPRPINPSIDDGKAWAQVIAGRLAFLAPQAAIKTRYDQVSDPLTFFGLPTSKIEDQGNHWAVRLQRAVIQLWKVDVPWAKAGQTTVANGGDVAKEAGLLPIEAVASQRSPLLAVGP